MHLLEEDVEKVILSLFLGAIIGAEREYRNKSAGFRTMILICVGSTMLTILSLMIGKNSSPDRMVANIITGIGFLGAGAIFRMDDRVSGLTTASTIWAAASIGITIGAGYYMLAILFTGIVLIILIGFAFFEVYIDRASQVRSYKITLPYQAGIHRQLEVSIRNLGLEITRARYQASKGEFVCNYSLTGTNKAHEKLVEEMLGKQEFSGFEF